MSYRPTIEEYAVGLALSASTRSEGLVTKVGAAILDVDGRILSLGYNGLPPRKKAGEDWLENREERRVHFIHAEANAFRMIGAGAYPFIVALTHSPCASCAQMITSYGVSKVCYFQEYEGCDKFKQIFDYAEIRYSMIKTDYTIKIAQCIRGFLH